MSTNIVMLVYDRLRLTRQALESLYAHTPEGEFTLTLVNDAGEDFRVDRLLREWTLHHTNCTLLEIVFSDHVLGRAKNIGVEWSRQAWGEGEWLYLSDNDVWFAPGWLGKLTHVAEANVARDFRLWGGQVHPFHRPTFRHDLPGGIVDEVEMLDGPSWLMRWKTWDWVGPLLRDAAPGTCQGEDVNWCQRLKRMAGGSRIGVIHPHVVVHTGLTNTAGEDAPGRDAREGMIPEGVIAE